MTSTFPDINLRRLKDIACSAAYLLIITLCLLIALEAFTIQTLNTSLLRALAVLLPLI
jgi:hypothetical protein